jgi:DNA polymerase-1
LISAINSAKVVALDIETFGPGKNDALDPWAGHIRMLSLAVPGLSPFLIDLQAMGYELPSLWTALQQAEVVGHNLKFDTLFLLVRCGVRLSRVWDTVTASRLLNAGTNAENDLKACLSRHLKVELAKELGTSNWGVEALSEQQIRYCADDVIHLLDLRDALQLALSAAGLDDVARLEMELLPSVVDMEARGFCVDLAALEEIRQSATTEMKAVEARFSEQAGAQINLHSPQQVLDVLKANGLKLDDTSKDTLAGIQHPLAEALLAYRKAEWVCLQAKTFRDATRPDGRIHARFEPTGTDTGRFSSKKPNLQNVSRGELRSCFIAPPGSKLIVADYSQIELRAAAAIAGEMAMIQAYERGEDLHRKTAAAVLSKSVDRVTKENRQLAKAVNFGLLYGQSAGGLVDYARSHYGVNLSPSDARAIHRRFFQTYPKLKAWHDAARKKAESGFRESRTRKGRRRLLPSGHGDKQEWNRFTGLVNTPVQGSCADGMKLAIIEVARTLPAGAGIVSTVHDELIIEAPDACAEEAKQIVELKMIAAMREIFPEVPITVEVTVGSEWTKG